MYKLKPCALVLVDVAADNKRPKPESPVSSAVYRRCYNVRPNVVPALVHHGNSRRQVNPIPRVVCAVTRIRFICRIRGSLACMYEPSLHVGVLLSYVLSLYFDILTQAKILLWMPAVFLLAFFYVPQTPAHLLCKQKSDVSSTEQVLINLSTALRFV